MKRLALALSLLLACGLTASVSAQKKPDAPRGSFGQPSAMKPGGSGKMSPQKGSNVSLTGKVTGMPSGKTFMISTKKGSTTIDASKAQPRYKGRFVSISALKAGTTVTAVGPMSGSTLMATRVTVNDMAGEKMGGSKSNDKKSGDRGSKMNNGRPTGSFGKPGTPPAGKK